MLIHKDLFLYDIQSAYPTILSKHHYDFKGVDLQNKKDRNIFLGIQQQGNENLSSFLLESVNNLIKFYLQSNNIEEDDIILIQRDGCILKKLLDKNDEFIKIKFRSYIDFLIFTPDMQKFLYSTDGDIVIKGVSHYYDNLNYYYQKFSNFNFYNKSTLFQQMHDFKIEFFNSNNKELFAIPSDDNSYTFFTYKGGIKVKDFDYVNINKINKLYYFNHYFKDFLTSIFLECY